MKNKNTGALFSGLFIAFLGITFLLNNFNLLDASYVFAVYWPMFIVLAGISQLFNKSGRNVASALFTIGIGIIFQFNTLGILPWELWRLLWPAVLIVAGASIVYSHFRNKPIEGDPADLVSSFVIMGGTQIRSTSEDFKGGNITAFMGGTELDLTGAKIKESASLNVSTIMGGIEIKVPNDWKVEISGMPILGAWDNKTNPAADSKKILRINATAFCGGIDIKN